MASATHTLGGPFTIGRSAEADVRLDTGRVSRLHAEVVCEAGRWWLRDTNSTNGIYHDGARAERVPLDGPTTVRLGREGPFLHFAVLDASGPSGAESGSEASADETRWASLPPLDAPRPSPEASRSSSEAPLPSSAAPPFGSSREEPPEAERPVPERTKPEAGAPDPSLSQLIGHYFEDDGGQPAGERTMMIRQAYKQVQQKQQRAYGSVIGAVAALLLVALGFAAWQQWRLTKLEGTTETLFYQMKAQDLQTAQLRRLIEEQGDAALSAQLAGLEERRERQAELYEGYIEELGLYRELSAEEREIYRVARIFNESEFTMPAGFVREVKAVIQQWQGSGRFENAVRTAEQNGYTRTIVRTMRHYGLPPEFFYLAMQESNFNACAVGPQTRWGIAKGMWQFIPTTGQAYGLVIGPRADLRVCDPLDERHDFAEATDAAARYLLYIYTELAQASGLLAMASYNWGEHRVIRNLDRMPETPLELVRRDVEGVPQNPQQRNYWHFLNEYRDRMPEETKGYVLHIFAAAVIGQNPRLFGFDFDNPLKPYIEEAAVGAVASAGS